MEVVLLALIIPKPKLIISVLLILALKIKYYLRMEVVLLALNIPKPLIISVMYLLALTCK